MKDFSRIEEVYSHLGYKNLSAFAQAVGINVQTFYDIKAGRCKLSQKVAEAINGKFKNISLSWLMTGEGSMLKDQPEQNKSEQSGIFIPRDVVQMFRDMAATIRSQQDQLASMTSREPQRTYILEKKDNYLNSSPIDGDGK